MLVILVFALVVFPHLMWFWLLVTVLYIWLRRAIYVWRKNNKKTPVTVYIEAFKIPVRSVLKLNSNWIFDFSYYSFSFYYFLLFVAIILNTSHSNSSNFVSKWDRLYDPGRKSTLENFQIRFQYIFALINCFLFQLKLYF